MAKPPTAAEFLSRFVSPLVKGGELHVAAPVPIAIVERWAVDLGNASVEMVDVDDARTAVLSTLVCRPPPLLLDADELMLAAGLHDALFLVHPRADKWTVSDRQRRKIIDTALSMVSQPLSRDRTRVMARHALLHNLFHLKRNDITVSWWTGRARFHGQKPPPRLTAWKGVRRVREDVTVVDFDDLLAVPDTAPVIATLLRRTPLTQLLDSHPGAPPLHWEDAVFVLRDAELVRAICYRLVPDGQPREVVAGPARLAAAFEQMLERAPAEADVRAVAAFLVHLNALFCMTELEVREANAKSALITNVLGLEVMAQRPRGLATLFALPAALAVVDPRLAIPPGVERDPPLARRWGAHRAQALELLGEALIDALAARLRRHLRPAAIEAARISWRWTTDYGLRTTDYGLRATSLAAAPLTGCPLRLLPVGPVGQLSVRPIARGSPRAPRAPHCGCAGPPRPRRPFVPVVVFLLLDVVRALVEQLHRGLEAVVVADLGVDRRVIVERLAVVDRRFLDLLDGGVDLADRLVLVPLHVGRAPGFSSIARADAHVAERVQVRRVRVRRPAARCRRRAR